MRVASIVLAALLALPAAAQTPPARPAAPVPAQQTKPPAKDTPLPTLNMVVPQRDRDAAFAYYRDEIAAGRCPAPLVRRDKACGAPAAQPTKPWRLDQPLPDGVKADAPPPGLIAKLSPSPAGHQYMRVDTDILVIGIGTRNVAALVVDLSRLQ
ncbi:hypothetical protein SAMN02990966_00961 [Rhodospirillales bacterium URHD0017]|nr:hypothetical protein SAMN02990966_00961 [Rhodospirillales bacterium URHD0017]